jgi:hypothetical protein
MHMAISGNAARISNSTDYGLGLVLIFSYQVTHLSFLILFYVFYFLFSLILS